MSASPNQDFHLKIVSTSGSDGADTEPLTPPSRSKAKGRPRRSKAKGRPRRGNRVRGDGTFANEDNRGPLRLDDIDSRRRAVVGEWPKRVGDILFCQSAEHEPVYLGTPTQLFAWLHARSPVSWNHGPKHVSREQYHEHLRMTAERFEAIETLPHWPPRPGTYYMHGPLPSPTGKLAATLSVQIARMNAVPVSMVWSRGILNKKTDWSRRSSPLRVMCSDL
jgi:hypothetical protein